nr:uncharacterized protein YyaL-like [Nerophis lumbriciformis]
MLNLGCLLLVIFTSLFFAEPVSGENQNVKENRLAKEKSPYLLQHAKNPVDWYPWGEEAFTKAKKEQKMILLSVGYSTCHWCHVMERESFEDQEIARYLNENFVSIKLDREERPDVDQVYMSFYQAMTGETGGWPLNMFLTPDLKPITGGTYFPPRMKAGRVGFLDVLKRVQGVWNEKPEEVAKNANAGFGQIEKYFGQLLELKADKDELKRELILVALEAGKERIDREWGGLDQGTKFPQVSLLRLFLSEGDEELQKLVLLTCCRMMEGGIHDQVGGGFHRYAVDREWLVPHFEKMLYDQAQMLELYLDAWLLTKDESYLAVARGIADYVMGEMRHEGGGFYCAQDAQSEGKEGKYFCWTLKELDELLDDEELTVVKEVMGVTEKGNFLDHSDPDPLHNLNVIHFKKKWGPMRSKKVAPGKDDKILASWNGLMIGALARASHVTGEKKYLEAAQKAHAFVKGKLWDGEKLYHRWREGERDASLQAESYLYLLRGTRMLYQATLEEEYLDFAVELADGATNLFYDKDQGGFFQGEARKDLVIRIKGEFDGATPSESSVATTEFGILAAITGEKKYEEIAEKTLRAYVPLMKQSALGMCGMMAGLDFYLSKRSRLVVTEGEGCEKWLEAAHQQFEMPVLLGTKGKVDPFSAGLPMKDQKATGYLCVGQACRAPETDSSQLTKILQEGVKE